MRSCCLIIALITICHVAKSQEHGGIEQYYYTGAGESVVVPKVYYESRHHWYGEMRYNYEGLQTVSFNAGKVFSNDRPVLVSVTPFAGLVLGRLNGGNTGANLKVEYKSVFFSSESQYTFSLEKRTENFVYNWSELGYELSDLIYAGLALQLTRPYQGANTWEPGAMLGFTYKSWTFPLYAFKAVGNKPSFVLGINWEWKDAKSSLLN